MATPRIQVDSWRFWAPESSDPTLWLEHWRAAGARAQDGNPDVEVIPPIQRRRASRLSKMVLSTALDVAAEQEIDYSIFCSQHGEIVRTREILRSISEREEISPTAFAQSVHNTGSGLYTIIAKSNAPSTSIASGANTFAFAWIEAQAYLANNPEHKVMLVNCDEVLPEDYQRHSERVHCDHALAMMLSAADGTGIDMNGISPGAENPLPQGPQFLAWLLSDEAAFTVTADEQGWRWQR